MKQFFHFLFGVGKFSIKYGEETPMMRSFSGKFHSESVKLDYKRDEGKITMDGITIETRFPEVSPQFTGKDGTGNGKKGTIVSIHLLCPLSFLNEKNMASNPP